MLDAGDRSCAMEATSHGSELGRLDRVRFAALVFTNLTQDHLDFHGTMERYFEAKRRLFTEHEPAAGRASTSATSRAGGSPTSCAPRLAPLARPTAPVDLRPSSDAPSGGVERSQLRRAASTSRTCSRAAAVARLLGVAGRRDRRGRRGARGVPGRFEAVDEGQPFTVVVDYAHKPDALENVLRTARELADGPR